MPSCGELALLPGEIMTMPGLGKVPGGARMDIDADGNVVGML